MEANKQTLVRKRTSVKDALIPQENVSSQFTIGFPKDHSQVLSRFEYVKTVHPRFDEIQTHLESIDS